MACRRTFSSRRILRKRRSRRSRRTHSRGGQDGYALRLLTSDKQVFLLLEHDGEKVGSAYSKRKDSSELALTQAISYAAHMIYKLYEQQTLQESMEGK